MEESVIKRIPPHSRDAEQAVLGAMLMNAEAITQVAEIITKDDFFESRYGIVFDAICQLHESGKGVDAIALREKLLSEDAPEEVCSFDFIRTLIQAVTTSALAGQHAKIIKDKAVLRRMIRVTEDLAERCYEGHEETEEILDAAEKSVFEVVQQRPSADFKPIMEIALDVLERIEQASKTDGHITGVSTGFRDLDIRTSGFQPSDMILIAARPSMGKTALVLNIAQNMALRQHLPVAIFSLEMSEDRLMERLIAMDSTVNSQNIRTGKLTDDEWGKVIESTTAISHSRMIIDATPNISMAELRSRARKYKLDHDIQAIFIDYLQLMNNGKKSDSRQQEVSDISRSLKSLARELNIPIVVLSQLNRSVEQRDDHRPMMSDLRESGAIEQDADVIMFIYRDDYYHKDTEEKNVAEIIIAKQRNGPIGTIKMIWLPEYTKFVNMKKEH